MIRTLAPLVALALAAPALQAQAAQDDVALLKKAIMDKVRARLELEHKRILEKVGQIIDDELSGRAPQPKPPETEAERRLADLQKKLDELDKAKKDLKRQIDQLKQDLSAAPQVDVEDRIKTDAKTKGPQDIQEANDLFNEANEDHTAKNFDTSILKFKYIHYSFPKTMVPGASAYNVCCGYSLQGNKAKACEWLDIAMKAGYRDYDHMRKDSDLDNIRNEKRYLELMADK